jgi:Flp pilus assembly pilin Flp
MKVKKSIQSFRSSQGGASLVEYGFLVAIILLGSIGSVIAFGQNITSYYVGTTAMLKDPTAAGISGVVFTYGDQVSPGYPDDDRFGHLAEGGNFLFGTDFGDSLMIDGTYSGVYGLRSNDVIAGSDASEIFVPGPGTDWINGGKGADTYSIGPGDGMNYIDETDGDSSIDTLNMPFSSLMTASAKKNGDDFYLIMANGEGISLRGYFKQFEYDGHFERAVFSDISLNSAQEFRDMVADVQKPSGSVYGTRLVENFQHSMAKDGSYTLYDDHYLADTDPGTLTFLDIGQESATFRNDFSSSKDDLIITLSDGDEVRIYDQHQINETKGISTVVFSGGTDQSTLDLTGIRSKAANDMKLSGLVTSTRWTEDLFHDMNVDGSYTLRNYQYLGDPLETFRLVNTLPDDVEFRQTGTNSQTDFEIKFSNGTKVLIEKGFRDPRASNYDGIKDVLFEGDPNDPGDDVYMDYGDILLKIYEDQRGTGYVRGSQAEDFFVYRPEDVNMSFYTGYGADSYTDTLDLSAYSEAATVFVKKYSELHITLETGQVFKVVNQYSANGGFEEIIFDGGATTLDLSQIEAKAES